MNFKKTVGKGVASQAKAKVRGEIKIMEILGHLGRNRQTRLAPVGER